MKGAKGGGVELCGRRRAWGGSGLLPDDCELTKDALIILPIDIPTVH